MSEQVRRTWLLPAVALLLAGGAVAAVLALRPATETATASAPGLGTVSARDLALNSHIAAPLVLERVYDGFAAGSEDEIYDTLAEVAAEEALVTLYLERMSTMASNGLAPDQQIHEMEILNLAATTAPREVTWQTTWRVLGTVGHAEHMHMRGNSYTAELRLQPVEGAWRLTGFALQEVDRRDAGTLQANPDAPRPDEATQ